MNASGLLARRRPAMVYALAKKKLHVPIVVRLGGGYGRDIDATVKAHVEVYRDLVGAF